MTYKQIEQSREIRLWITQIIAPVTLVAVAVAANPEAKQKIGDKIRAMKQRIRNRKLNKN